jgi:hypothetical protein
MTPSKITPEMLPAMQGVIPPAMATCTADGTPNVTAISQVYYADDSRIAISRQFFNTTFRNLNENPSLAVVITCPETFSMWKIGLRFLESQSDGPVYDQMAMQLEAIATMQGMTDVFSLMSADICAIESIETLFDGRGV